MSIVLIKAWEIEGGIWGVGAKIVDLIFLKDVEQFLRWDMIVNQEWDAAEFLNGKKVTELKEGVRGVDAAKFPLEGDLGHFCGDAVDLGAKILIAVGIFIPMEKDFFLV